MKVAVRSAPDGLRRLISSFWYLACGLVPTLAAFSVACLPHSRRRSCGRPASVQSHGSGYAPMVRTPEIEHTTRQARTTVREVSGHGGTKIRIRLKAYDHEVIDNSAKKIVETVTRTGAQVAGPRAAADWRRTCTASSVRRTSTRTPRALRDAYTQASY